MLRLRSRAAAMCRPQVCPAVHRKEASGAKGKPWQASATASSGEQPAPDGTSGIWGQVVRARALQFAARAATSLCASKRIQPLRALGRSHQQRLAARSRRLGSRREGRPSRSVNRKSAASVCASASSVGSQVYPRAVVQGWRRGEGRRGRSVQCVVNSLSEEDSRCCR